VRPQGRFNTRLIAFAAFWLSHARPSVSALSMGLNRAELREEHIASIADRDDCGLRAITRQDIAQLGQAHVAVPLDQSGHRWPPMSLAPEARDLEDRDPAGEVAERDRGGNSKVTRLAGISVMFP
jgi:hypothetical protein